MLSKGHTAPGLYSALANRGFFPVEDLPTLRHIESYLQGHPNMNTVPGVDMSTTPMYEGTCQPIFSITNWNESFIPEFRPQ